ncbi:hypothetical protein [Tenacibaculum sp. UWU-22]|uniref:hypothetical protein n=1 Tax=Tenacibaculum sp. UWU-22 TaxID=3234187 RepID=UPI0034DAE35B
MKKVILFLFLIIGLSCKQESNNIFDDLTNRGGFALFETDLDPLHDITGEDETVVNINIVDPDNNAVKYEVAIEKDDNTLTDVVGTVTSFPGNLIIKRQDVINALGLSSAEELPKNVTFVGTVTTDKGIIVSGLPPNFDTDSNTNLGGDTYYDGIANIKRQAMKFNMVMFQLIKPNEEKSFFIQYEEDDVEEVAVDMGDPVGTMDLTSSDLELGEKSSGQGLMNIGLRFNFIGLPKGANITSAKIQFQTDDIGSNPVELIIYGENTGNSEPFEKVLNNLSKRSLTSANVAWSVPEWVNKGDRGEAQKTVDLSSIIQEIVNRDDWVPGNSISIIIKPTGDTLNVTSSRGGREAEAGVGSDSAELILEYTN